MKEGEEPSESHSRSAIVSSGILSTTSAMDGDGMGGDVMSRQPATAEVESPRSPGRLSKMQS